MFLGKRGKIHSPVREINRDFRSQVRRLILIHCELRCGREREGRRAGGKKKKVRLLGPRKGKKDENNTRKEGHRGLFGPTLLPKPPLGKPFGGRTGGGEGRMDKFHASSQV